MHADRHDVRGDQLGIKYAGYARDRRVPVEAQIRTAEESDFDYVSAISDPAREAADYGAQLSWLEDQPPDLSEANSLITDKSRRVRCPSARSSQ